jgi:predicted O-methyltransferase YrrM
MMVGVDVMIQEQVKLMASMFERSQEHQVYLFEANSLEVLPKMIDQGLTFDLILLDGDHNYHTVRQELESVDLLLNQRGICIVDDYHGRWSDKDLWYSQRPEYENNQLASKPIDTDKHGVKPAVDEFIGLHSSWSTLMPIMGEPIVLIKG